MPEVLKRTAHLSFKDQSKRYFWGGLGVAAVVHILIIWVFSPKINTVKITKSPPQFPVALDIPPEIKVPPPPQRVTVPPREEVVKVQIPTISEEVVEEVTIPETTLEAQSPIPARGPSLDDPTFTPFDVPPRPVKRVDPKYPDLLRKAGIEGRVILWVQVDTTGKVLRVQVAQPSGFEALDDSAVKALKQWEYIPAKSRDTPVKVWYQHPVIFTLDSKR